LTPGSMLPQAVRQSSRWPLRRSRFSASSCEG
jgi:hypothetical protein